VVPAVSLGFGNVLLEELEVQTMRADMEVFQG
jgi:hypothetical protein